MAPRGRVPCQALCGIHGIMTNMLALRLCARLMFTRLISLCFSRTHAQAAAAIGDQRPSEGGRTGMAQAIQAALPAPRTVLGWAATALVFACHLSGGANPSQLALP